MAGLVKLLKLQGQEFSDKALEFLDRLESALKYPDHYPDLSFSKEDLEGEIELAFEQSRISEGMHDELMKKLEDAEC